MNQATSSAIEASRSSTVVTRQVIKAAVKYWMCMGKTEIPELVDLIRELMKQIEDLRTQLHTQRPCVAEANTQTEFQDISAPLTNDQGFRAIRNKLEVLTPRICLKE